jgi:hypothetical protein
MHGMGRYSLKRFFVACTCICIGTGLLATLPHQGFWNSEQSGDWGSAAIVVSTFAGLLAAVGVAILLRKDPIWFALAGALIGMTVFVLTAPNHFPLTMDFHPGGARGNDGFERLAAPHLF